MLMDQGVLGEQKFSGKQGLLTSIEGVAGDARRRKVRQVEAMAWLCVLNQPLPPGAGEEAGERGGNRNPAPGTLPVWGGERALGRSHWQVGREMKG